LVNLHDVVVINRRHDKTNVTEKSHLILLFVFFMTGENTPAGVSGGHPRGTWDGRQMILPGEGGFFVF
ncbi:MAG: hypothetical protein Q8M35_03660, partial [Pseudohongiella sp.]|nr:hypothetical protein [Pseudohongiella sp.]